MRVTRLGPVLFVFLAAGCGDDDPAVPDAGPTCELDTTFDTGGEGVAAPLAAVGPDRAAAGRLAAGDLPDGGSDLATWAAGDFVLANDRVAMVIEDVGPSDLYDPWGGRPVGVALVEDGALTGGGDFGEFLVLTGRHSVVTTSVGVIADGSDGGPAIVRAVGVPAPTPFFENITGALFREPYEDIPTAIDYVLEPGADHIDIRVHHRSPRTRDADQPFTMHAMLYAARMPAYAPGIGFDEPYAEDVPYLAFIDDDAASFAYAVPGHTLEPLIAASGFVSMETEGFTVAACAETSRDYARIYIGGPGLDPLRAVVEADRGEAQRVVTGTVENADATPAAGVRVHATLPDGGYLTRALTAADGSYALHVPAGAEVQLHAWRRGDGVPAPVTVTGDTAPAISLPAAGAVHVVATDTGDQPLPVRVQVLPQSGTALPSVPGSFGEPRIPGGRLHVAYPTGGDITLPVTAGDWEVVVSRGYEYELVRQQLSVEAGQTAEVTAALERVVDTTGAQCGDFHIHTHRSNDSGDDARLKVRSAAADGVELPVRTEHEFAATFQPLIEELGLEAFAYGIGAIEMTSMEIWGHMNVFPLDPDPVAVNGGAPLWQRFPSAEDTTAPVETLTPPEVFADVRARPERPAIIINHPRGGANYFDYVGFDRDTGMVRYPELWDEEFTLVEIFNDAHWRGQLDGLVRDWFNLLDTGRRVFAVGSSDTHGLSGSPVGYPRTCIEVGTDDPTELTADGVRDAMTAGHTTVSGGVYVDAWIDGTGPGREVSGAGAMTDVRIRVQAASWIDVDAIDLVVDGAVVATIPITPEDADPLDPAVRFDELIPIDVADTGSYVIVAAYGDAPLDPVHPGKTPFGVTNPIFVYR